MFEDSKIEDVIDKDFIYIDLRSPSEYKSSHIAGALNLPILDDDERKIVGTLYDNSQVEKAKLLAVKYASVKLSDFYEKIVNLTKEATPILYCSRGGMRSGVLFNFLRSMKIPVKKLHGGYKAYRNYQIEALKKMTEEIDFIVLDGYTGCGKTHIIEELKGLGLDTLNLEKCANHRGSILGAVLLSDQPSQKQFETNIFEELRKRKSNLVFVEAESIRIGKLNVPKYLFDKYNSSKRILITSSLEKRKERIKKDYVHDNDLELIDTLKNLKKRINENLVDQMIKEIENKNYDTVIERLMVNYYDPHYKSSNKTFIKKFLNENSRDTALKIKEFLNEKNKMWKNHIFFYIY